MPAYKDEKEEEHGMYLFIILIGQEKMFVN